MEKNQKTNKNKTYIRGNNGAQGRKAFVVQMIDQV